MQSRWKERKDDRFSGIGNNGGNEEQVTGHPKGPYHDGLDVAICGDGKKDDVENLEGKNF